MKVLVTGCGGQLGRALIASAPPVVRLTGVSRSEMNITDDAAVQAVCSARMPDVVINAAAYSAVDRAEDEPEAAYQANRDGPRILAEYARGAGVRLIHISTDYVFDGARSVPYRPDDQPNPLSVYGRSKLEGERFVLGVLPENSVIVRTAWLYSNTGSNFVKKILGLLAARNELRVVSDQVGTPTSVASLAEAVWAVVRRPELTGIYHWTDAGAASWYDFAVAIQHEARMLGQLGGEVSVLPVMTDEYPSTARRPMYSLLDKTASYRDLGIKPVHWQTNLKRMLEEAGR